MRATLRRARDLLAQPMIVVGKNRHATLLEQTRDRSFLLIDDGPLIDEFIASDKRKHTELDFTKDSFNIFLGMDYFRACDFVSILDHAFPAGETTLRRQDANSILLKTLAPKDGHPPRSLQKLLYRLIPPTPKDLEYKHAYQNIELILLSPVLESVFCNPPTFSMRGIILARIDRTKYAERDCKLLANFLIARYKGHVIVPDFGYYACPFHALPIRENRLIAGANFLREIPEPLRTLLLLSGAEGKGATFADAEVLAENKGLRPDPMRDDNNYNKDIAEAME